jgi:hypothetical protein
MDITGRGNAPVAEVLEDQKKIRAKGTEYGSGRKRSK